MPYSKCVSWASRCSCASSAPGSHSSTVARDAQVWSSSSLKVAGALGSDMAAAYGSREVRTRDTHLLRKVPPPIFHLTGKVTADRATGTTVSDGSAPEGKAGLRQRL